jgi:hypothetical protein
METTFRIQLEFSGLAIFDPYNLNNFCIRHNISVSNLMDFFIKNPLIGDSAISEGIILPIYSILTEDYNIVISDNTAKRQPLMEHDLFEYKSFPLSVINNKLVISDIYSLIEWDSLFYQNIQPYEKETFSQYAISLENSNYSVDIIGFFEDKNNFGYRLVFNKVVSLPAVKGDSDSYNFNVVKLIQTDGRMNIIPEKH